MTKARVAAAKLIHQQCTHVYCCHRKIPSYKREQKPHDHKHGGNANSDRRSKFSRIGFHITFSHYFRRRRKNKVEEHMGRSLKYKRTDARLSSSFTSEDLQGGGVFSVVVWPYDDLHVLIEGDEEAQEVPHGELAEVAAQLLEASEEIKIPRDRCAWNLTLRQAQGRLSRKERETWGALCMS